MRTRVNLEEWKQSPVFGDCYDVSSLGRVVRTKKGRGTQVGKVLKHQMGTDGYPYVHLSYECERICISVHYLVACAFLGKRPKGKVCNHKNGDKTDPRKVNLEWVTKREDVIHAQRVLGKGVGATNTRSKKCIITSPKGEIFEVTGITEFCRKNSLHQGHMSEVARGKLKQYKGWLCKYVS